jgi:hypothetical protein
MCLRLSHPVQIEAALDFVQTTLEPFGVGPVEAGEPVERSRGAGLARVVLLDGGRTRLRWLVGPSGMQCGTAA